MESMVAKYILGNWKMHGTQSEARALAREIVAYGAPEDVKVVLFPPFTALAGAGEMLSGSAVLLGGQDCSPERHGAFTGDVSAGMLRDAGCSHVIVGHSERRSLHGESDALVRRKAQSALDAGLVPVICVGESLEERETGHYLEVIRAQAAQSMPSLGPLQTLIIAYEPVWAIGSGKTPTTAEICEVHKSIASVITYATSGARMPIVYGGSVKAASARDILASRDIDGVLVGGASLKATEFCAIIAAARNG